MTRPKHFGTLLVLIGLLLLPALSRSLMALVGWIGGCRAEAGATAACLVGGTDWGGVLATLGFIGWFALFTVPLAVLLVGVAVFTLLRS